MRTLTAMALCALFFSSGARAQDDGRFLFTAGTTYTSTSGVEWAYLNWQATDYTLFDGRYFAVYAKSGAPAAGGAFSRLGIASLQTDPQLIQALISRGEQLGDPAADLMADVDALYSGLDLDPSISDGEKIMHIITSSLGDEDAYSSLILLARKHPAIAMALGHGFATRINASGFTTFEIREYDVAADRAGAILGRVTVEGGNPVVLPAPDGLVEVPEASPKGDLNVRLRWNEPDALLRLSLLHFGYNVYRMDRNFALAEGYIVTPPDPDEMAELLVVAPDEVRQINTLPVIPNDAAGAGEPFAVDDNGRYEAGGAPFTDGAEYVYFVAARDLLGRDGEMSDGLEVQVCKRLPPRAPRGVEVTRVRSFVGGPGGYATNVLKITWDQNESTPGDETVNYYVYRWTSLTNDQFRGTSTTVNLFAGPVPHLPGSPTNSIIDDTLTTNDFTVTYWYTVRATDDAVCGPNYSGHSPPGFGALMDWDGPGAVTGGRVLIDCIELYATEGQSTTEPPDKAGTIYRARCELDNVTDNRIDWVEFKWIEELLGSSGLTNATMVGRFPVQAGASNVTVNLPSIYKSITVYCRAGTDDGKTSNWANQSGSEADRDIRVVGFRAGHTITNTAAGGDCFEHEDGGVPDGPLGDPPGIEFPMPDDAHEWRVYRRVDQGPLMLIRQGTNAPSTNVSNIQDNVVGTLYCAEICYYAQTYDIHGNAGPLSEIGCIASGIRPPATPQLSVIRPGGDASAPTMQLHWICSPYGVDRFEVWIGMADQPPVSFGSAVTTNILPDGSTGFYVSDSGSEQLLSGAYRTPRVGPAFGTPGSAEFTLELPIELNREYTVMVRAIGACDVSAHSLASTIAWYQEVPGPEVPWPARPLPEVRGDFHPNLKALYLASTNGYALDFGAVRIGEFQWLTAYNQNDGPKEFVWFDSNSDPSSYLYTDQYDGSDLLPFILYRTQVPSADLPRVSGDVVQVSPLVESVAFANEAAGVTLYDPFIAIAPEFVPGEPETGYLYFIDTQPVIKGAAYRYMLVQFDEFFEPKRVIPLSGMEVP